MIIYVHNLGGGENHQYLTIIPNVYSGENLCSSSVLIMHLIPDYVPVKQLAHSREECH